MGWPRDWISAVCSSDLPAPLSMLETIIQYKSEYVTDAQGRRVNFRYNRRAGEFERDERGELIPDRRGRPYRQWRDNIRRPADIWAASAQAAQLTGTTSAPKVQTVENQQM